MALALLAWLAWGAFQVRRIVRRAEALTDPDWQASLYEIADRLGLDAAPRLLRSDDVKMPFAAGLTAPTIVLPASSDEWNAERRTAVLIHELGHVRRHDLVGHTLGRIACALYWFHPLVWTAARHLRAESERACDDLALAFGTRPSEYAEHLLDIVTCVRDHATPSIALALAHRKEFEGRMLAILNPELRRKGMGRMGTAAPGHIACSCSRWWWAVPCRSSARPCPATANWSRPAGANRSHRMRQTHRWPSPRHRSCPSVPKGTDAGEAADPHRGEDRAGRDAGERDCDAVHDTEGHGE